MASLRYPQSARCVNVPLFLAPAFAELSIAPTSIIRPFSSTTNLHLRKKNRDLNKRRGESVMRSTGPRHPLYVQRKFKELPQPRAEADRPLDEFPYNPNHGLYGFFTEDKKTILTPEAEETHGRAWTYQELVFKSFEDLHALYWQGILERNRAKTRSIEHLRLKLGYGKPEIKERMQAVTQTLLNIRRVLKNRQEAWEEAKLLREHHDTVEDFGQWINEEGDRRLQKEQSETSPTVPKIKITREPEASQPSLGELPARPRR